MCRADFVTIIVMEEISYKRTFSLQDAHIFCFKYQG